MNASRVGWTLFLVVLLHSGTSSAQDPILLDSRGMVDIWSIPQAAPAPGFHATKLIAKAQDPEALIVTLAFLSIEGPLHQVWKSADQGDQATPTVTDWQLPADDDLIVYDSHYLLPGLPGFRIADGFDGWVEDLQAQPTECETVGLPVEDCNLTGVGGIRTGSVSNAVWFEVQDDEVDLAYLVVSPSAASNEIELSAGLYGQGFVNAEPGPNGALWGFGDAEPLRFVIPEPATHAMLLFGFGMFALRVTSLV